MSLKLTKMGVVLDTDKTDELADFYEKLLGWKKRKYTKNSVLFHDPDDGMPFQIILQYDENYMRPVWPTESGKQQQMAHLDFFVDNLEEGAAHALSCGAVLSPIQFNDSWRVMIDPAGHPFCICPK